MNVQIKAKHFKNAIFANASDCALARATRDATGADHVNECVRGSLLDNQFVYTHPAYTESHFNRDRIIAFFLRLIGFQNAAVRTIAFTPFDSTHQPFDGVQIRVFIDGKQRMVRNGYILGLSENDDDEVITYEEPETYDDAPEYTEEEFYEEPDGYTVEEDESEEVYDPDEELESMPFDPDLDTYPDAEPYTVEPYSEPDYEPQLEPMSGCYA